MTKLESSIREGGEDTWVKSISSQGSAALVHGKHEEGGEGSGLLLMGKAEGVMHGRLLLLMKSLQY